MTIRTSILTILVMGLLTFLFGCSEHSGPRPAKQEFAELSYEDSARLEQQRRAVEGVVNERYGIPALTKTRQDLPTLQRLLDDRVFSKTQTYELQCLGVAFGDVLASELPLRWMMVTDAFGTDPTLRYKDSSIQINALTMISKRVEDDRETKLADLMEGIRYSLKQMVESGKYK